MMGESKRRQKLDSTFGNPVKARVVEIDEGKWICVAVILREPRVVSYHNHIEQAIEKANEVLVKFNRFSADQWFECVNSGNESIYNRAFSTLEFDESLGGYGLSYERGDGGLDVVPVAGNREDFLKFLGIPT